MKKGIIVIPACNEATGLAHFLPTVSAVQNRLAKQFQIVKVVIDDGSTDDTEKVVKDADGCLLVRNDINRGLGYSLRKGYQLAANDGYDFLVSMDSDGQHDVSLLPQALELLISGCDLVIASRYHPQSEKRGTPMDRELLNISFSSIMRAITGWEQLTDPLSGFWVMKGWVAGFLAENLKLERYGTCLEGIIKLRFLSEVEPVIKEIPHPAIYQNNDSGFLNREYSPANREERVERFGTHALHVLEALEDVRAAGCQKEVEEAINVWRSALL